MYLRYGIRNRSGVFISPVAVPCEPTRTSPANRPGSIEAISATIQPPIETPPRMQLPTPPPSSAASRTFAMSRTPFTHSGSTDAPMPGSVGARTVKRSARRAWCGSQPR